MSEVICPACHAELRGDLFSPGSSAVCPFCQQTIPVPPDRGEESPAAIAPRDNPPRPRSASFPPDCGIQVLEDSEQQLLLYLPARSSPYSRSLGLFAALWNGLIGVILFAIIRDLVNQQVRRGGAGAGLPVIILLGIVGLGLLTFWLRERYTSLLILLDSQRIAVQKTLFGRKKIAEFSWRPGSAASRLETMKHNETPLYAVAVSTTTRTVTFGAGLAEDIQEQLVELINRRLPVERFGISRQGGVDAVKATHPRVLPTDIPSDCGLIWEATGSDRLKFQLPAVAAGQWRSGRTLWSLLAALIWLAVMWQFLPAGLQNWLFWPAAITAGVFLPLLVIWIVGHLVLRASRIIVDLDRERLQCRYTLGNSHRWGVVRSLPTREIIRVAVTNCPDLGHTGSRRRATSDLPVRCYVFGTAGPPLKLTWAHPVELSNLVAALVYTRLVEWGCFPHE